MKKTVWNTKFLPNAKDVKDFPSYSTTIKRVVAGLFALEIQGDADSIDLEDFSLLISSNNQIIDEEQVRKALYSLAYRTKEEYPDVAETLTNYRVQLTEVGMNNNSNHDIRIEPSTIETMYEIIQHVGSGKHSFELIDGKLKDMDDIYVPEAKPEPEEDEDGVEEELTIKEDIEETHVGSLLEQLEAVKTSINTSTSEALDEKINTLNELKFLQSLKTTLIDAIRDGEKLDPNYIVAIESLLK